jgi:uncharacterized protein
MTITVRKQNYKFDPHSPSYWYGDNKFVSPAGERFFIESVRDNLDKGMTEEMHRNNKAFTEQEAQHSKAHMAFNAWLAAKGYKAEEFESVVKDFIKLCDKMSPKQRLAATCALEHITALMAERLVGEADIYAAPICEEFREFWKWHAMEEYEHKSVAFDVYRHKGYDEFTRMYIVVASTVALIVGIAGAQVYLSWTKKGWRGPLDIARGSWILYGPRGFITKSIPAYLQYYKPGFHPTDRD